MSGKARPVSSAVTEALRDYIKQNRLPSGTPIESEQRLSERFCASRGTVRSAIQVLIDTGELVRKPYSRPVVGAARVHCPKVRPGRDVYVWVSHPISDHATLMFLKGISRGLEGTPFRMVVREPTRFFGEHVREDEKQFFVDLLKNEQAVGAIIQRDACLQSASHMKALLDAGVPLIFADSPPPEGVVADYVGSANAFAARQCTEHLINLGHKRVACLVDTDWSEVIQNRIRGYRRAMEAAGLADHIQCIVASDIDPTTVRLKTDGREVASVPYRNWGRRVVSEVLAMDVRPTALFIGCDVLAEAVWTLLEAEGVRVPEEISIVGFDWLARWESIEADRLTTASQDFEGFGWYAADLLLDRLRGEAPSQPRQLLLPASLVIRASSSYALLDAPPSLSSADTGQFTS